MRERGRERKREIVGKEGKREVGRERGRERRSERELMEQMRAPVFIACTHVFFICICCTYSKVDE